MTDLRFAESSYFAETRVQFDVFDGPIIKPEYSSQEFQVDHATVRLIRGTGYGSAWGLNGVQVSGRRVLKSGLGKEWRDRTFGHYSAAVPDWLQPLVDAALAAANSGEPS